MPPTLREQHLKILWDILPRPTSESVVRLMSRDGGKIAGDYARTFRELALFASASEGCNVYVAPNPTEATTGVRHSAADVTHWSWLLLDFDPVCGCPKSDDPLDEDEKCVTCLGQAAPLQALDVGLRLLEQWLWFDFHGQPPIIIDSGRGAQAWIRLDDWTLNDSGDSLGLDESIDRKVARKVTGYWLKRLAEFVGYSHGCRVDTSTSDLPRVMRCPGTVNQKTGRLALFEIASTCRYDGITQRLVDGVPPAAMVDPVVEGVVPGQKWTKVFPHLTKTAQDYLKFGQVEPGRHKVMWHTAKKLQELGVTREEAYRALARANALRGRDEELEADQIGHALDTAYGK